VSPERCGSLSPALFSIDFTQIPLEPFEALPAELRTEEFFRANELVNAYVDARSRDVAALVGPQATVAPERAPVWSWILERAAAARLDPGVPSQALREAALTESPELRAALDLIDAAAEGYPAFLRGERSGSSILFDPASPGLWEDYFSNENPVYGAGNLLAAHAAASALGGRRARALEVGAGCGSAAESLWLRLGDAIVAYRLTDISPGFLRKARERLDSLRARGAAGALEPAYQLLDLNRPPSTWRIAPGSFDLVYAVNVLHAVRDLLETLRGLRDVLSGGGVLVLGECVRPARGRPVHPEFVFQLLDELRDAVLDPACRPNPGFLDEASWRASLERAGFSSVRFVPDFAEAVKAYPAHSLAAIVAWRD